VAADHILVVVGQDMGRLVVAAAGCHEGRTGETDGEALQEKATLHGSILAWEWSNPSTM
jgi:hypothetical protein